MRNLRRNISFVLVLSFMISLVFSNVSVFAAANLTRLGGVDYSAVYDFDYYINRYSDVKNAFGGDQQKVLYHFVNYGMKEGRQGNALFDVNSYKNAHLDLRNVFGADLQRYYIHYMNYGKKEGRVAVGVSSPKGFVTKLGGIDYSAVYNRDYYISRYPDIKKAFGGDDVKTLNHFVNYGIKEGRQGSASFDVNSYKNAHADLRSVFGNDLKSYYMHYINYGKLEGRVSVNVTVPKGYITRAGGVDYSLVYDKDYYLQKNPDVKAALGTDEVKVLNHFVNYGIKEGRCAKATFNVFAYITRYSDLRKAYGYDYRSYYMHYMKNGYREGRLGSGVATKTQANNAIAATLASTGGNSSGGNSSGGSSGGNSGTTNNNGIFQGYKYIYSGSSANNNKVYHTCNCGHLPMEKNIVRTNTINTSVFKKCSYCQKLGY